MKVLVTGATGFIGSAFIRRVCSALGLSGVDNIVGFSRDTDQRSMYRLANDVAVLLRTSSGHFRLVHGDLNGDISGLCEGIDVVVNFAARTFVDHSIRDARPFVLSNVLGTLNLLEDARRHKVKHFIQISTDEVYGAILEGAYTETAALNPTNPYAASKAGADALAIAYAHTFGMHTTITRTENNAGPWQHPQKVFPTFVRKLLHREKLPVYGDGKHVRQWLHVDDHVDAILYLIANREHTKPGDVFHVAGNQELTNIELAQRIIRAVSPGENPEDWIAFVPDHDVRPGHDRRYALDCAKLRALGWCPKVSLDSLIWRTTKWYVENPSWLE